MFRYFKTVGNDNNEISSWKSKVFFKEKISSINTSNYSLTPKVVYRNMRMRAEFLGYF